MAVRQILIAGAAAAALISPALAASARADDDYYLCNDHLCYDDQAEATRQLNRQALENPGYDDEAMPSYGQPGFDDEDRGRDQYRERHRYRDRDDQYRGQYDDRGYDQGMPSDDEGYSRDDDN